MKIPEVKLGDKVLVIKTNVKKWRAGNIIGKICTVSRIAHSDKYDNDDVLVREDAKFFLRYSDGEWRPVNKFTDYLNQAEKCI